MTAEKAIEAYSARFGGWPDFLFMGADDDYIVEKLTEALRMDKEYEAPDPDADY